MRFLRIGKNRNSKEQLSKHKGGRQNEERVRLREIKNADNGATIILGVSNGKRQPVFRDYASKNTSSYPGKTDPAERNNHMNHLFDMSKKLVEETSQERRPSLLTNATATDETPCSDIPFGAGFTLPSVRPKHRVSTKREMELALKRRGAKLKKEEEPLDFFEVVKKLDFCNLCCDPDLESETVDFLNSELQEPFKDRYSSIPREISFTRSLSQNRSMLTDGTGSLNNSASFNSYSVLKQMEEVSDGKPSIMKRLASSIKRDTSVVSRCKVYVESPDCVTTGPSSVDGSTLTMPSDTGS